MPTAFVNNIWMHYVEAGPGFPLLLHGLRGSHEMWLPVVPELARSYRVIAADHRGHGASGGAGVLVFRGPILSFVKDGTPRFRKRLTGPTPGQ